MIRTKYDVIKKNHWGSFVHCVPGTISIWLLTFLTLGICFVLFSKKKWNKIKEKRNVAMLKKAGKWKWLINLVYENSN